MEPLHTGGGMTTSDLRVHWHYSISFFAQQGLLRTLRLKRLAWYLPTPQQHTIILIAYILPFYRFLLFQKTDIVIDPLSVCLQCVSALFADVWELVVYVFKRTVSEKCTVSVSICCLLQCKSPPAIIFQTKMLFSLSPRRYQGQDESSRAYFRYPGGPYISLDMGALYWCPASPWASSSYLHKPGDDKNCMHECSRRHVPFPGKPCTRPSESFYEMRWPRSNVI